MPTSCWPVGADGQVLPPPRMIQEEKECTQLRAEELETRVTSGSMEALDLPQLHRRGPIPTSLTALSLASGSPAVIGHTTPTGTSRSAAQDLDRMGVMTLVSLGMALPSLGSALGTGEGYTSSRNRHRQWALGQRPTLVWGRAPAWAGTGALETHSCPHCLLPEGPGFGFLGQPVFSGDVVSGPAGGTEPMFSRDLGFPEGQTPGTGKESEPSFSLFQPSDLRKHRRKLQVSSALLGPYGQSSAPPPQPQLLPWPLGCPTAPPALSLYPLMAPLSVQPPVSREQNREDKATIKCETSPPSSPRMLRLEKLGHPALSQEEGKR